MRIARIGPDLGWSQVIDGLNEVSKKIYFMLFDRFRERGLLDCFRDGTATMAELEERFGVEAGVRHRFRVALGGLRALGVVAIEGEQVRLRRGERPDEPVDDELIFSVFGHGFARYLAIYHEDMLLTPGFHLSFDGQQAALWEGLLTAPINTVGSDQAIDWIARPGGRVLELAFGPAATFPKLLDRIGGEGELYGVDKSSYYVERARTEYAGMPNVKNIVEADINDGLSFFDDGMFEGIMFMGTLQFIHDPPRLFDEFRRIIKRRGRLVLGAFHTDKPCFANPALHLHMNLFDPPALEYSLAKVIRWLREREFEANIAVEFGSYCSLYAEQMPEVAFP